MNTNKRYEARFFGLLIDWKHPQLDWGDVWYQFKLSLKNFKRFFHAIWWFRGDSPTKTLNLLRIALEEHGASMVKYPIHYEEELSTLSRCLELIKNIEDDNYSERCGYDYNYEQRFDPIIEDGVTYFTLVSLATEEQKINNEAASIKALKLEQAEWDELFDKLKHYKNGLRAWI